VFGRLTNDCTNFVSQTLLAGGWPMVGSHDVRDRAGADQWWFGGSAFTKCSYAWGGAQNLHDFLQLSGRGRIVSSIDQLHEGDIVQFKNTSAHVWHSMVVTGKASGDLLLSYHTNDNLDKTLTATDVPPELWILWKISDLIPQPRKGTFHPPLPGAFNARPGLGRNETGRVPARSYVSARR
jgi:hypothetical protein